MSYRAAVLAFNPLNARNKTLKRVIWQTVTTQMKCNRTRHFVGVYTFLAKVKQYSCCFCFVFVLIFFFSFEVLYPYQQQGHVETVNSTKPHIFPVQS